MKEINHTTKTILAVAGLIFVGQSSTQAQTSGRPQSKKKKPVESNATKQFVTRSEYVIADFTKIFGAVTASKTDATISTPDSKHILFSGYVEMITNISKEDLVKGETITDVKPNGWGTGARHTLKGKLKIQGYTFVSSPEDPLVFRVGRNYGYEYERGKGTVTTPTGDEIHLVFSETPATPPLSPVQQSEIDAKWRSINDEEERIKRKNEEEHAEWLKKHPPANQKTEK